MKFWDSSAVVPLVVRQAFTPALHRIYLSDPVITVWWGTWLECGSALARLRRGAQISAAEFSAAAHNLDALATSWQEVLPEDRVRQKARDLLAYYPLRAADALQLAAAFSAAQALPSRLEFICLDRRLAVAAEREEFRVVTI